MPDLWDGVMKFGLEHAADRWYGTGYRAIVEDTKDPKGQGRILMRIPGVLGNEVHGKWAYPSFPAGGGGHGFFWPPYEGDPVLAWFEMGDTRAPNYSGGWYGESDVPEPFKPVNGEAPVRRGFSTKKGMYIVFDEKDDEETVQIAWTNKDASKAAMFVIDKFGGITLAGSSGRRLSLDEENDQLFFVDGSGSTLIGFGPENGLLVTYNKDGKSYTIALDPNADAVTIQSSGDVTISAPSIGLEGGSVAIGGTKAKEPQVLGQTLVNLLTQLITQVAAITVNTPAGPSSPPVNAGAIAALAGQLINALSKKHNVE